VGYSYKVKTFTMIRKENILLRRNSSKSGGRPVGFIPNGSSTFHYKHGGKE
jgi:hypothetical protein